MASTCFLVSARRLHMKHELAAHLVRGDGHISDIPTEGLLVALDQLIQASSAQEHSIASTQAAVYGFLQAIRQAMREITFLDPELH
jgi:hypothetical protein